MFSKTCEYAIRAMIFIAQKSKDGSRVGIKDISSGIDSPEYFIAKILQELSRKGFVQSAKGPNGGFFMERGGRPVYLIDVVKVVDGLHMFFDCGLGLKKCSDRKPCPIHQSFKAVRETLHHEFCTVTIQDLATDIEQGMAYLRR